MKFFKTLGLTAAAALFFSACDYVSVPQQAGGTTGGGGGGNGVTKRVLVEDYTGHFCSNCPRGARTLDTLEQIYGDSIIIPMAVHVGFFAEPASVHGLVNGAPAGSFATDFRTPEGNDLDATFLLSGSLPNGMVNRLGFPNLQHSTDASNWRAKVASELSTPATADLVITRTYDTTSRVLNVTVSGKILEDTTGLFMVKTVITEDSVYEWQVDDTQPTTGNVVQYWHKHILRAAIDHPGSGWGDTAVSGTIPAQTVFSRTYSNYNVSSNWNHRHCHIVAYIYDDATKQVLQAATIRLKQ